MDNEKKCYLYNGMWSVVLLFISGGILQSFFVEIGFSGNQIASYVSLINVAQIVMMMTNFFLADRVKRIREVMAVMMLGPLPFTLFMLGVCFAEQMDVTVVYVFVMFLCFLQNLFVGFYNVLNYRFPYLVIDMKHYVRLTNNSGIIGSAFSIAISGLISFLTVHFPFRWIMAVGFTVTILFCIAGMAIVKSMKVINPYQEDSISGKISMKKMKNREFRFFLLPNFLRGLSNGGVSIVAVICAEEITDNSAVISGLVTISAVAMIAGSGLYEAIRKKISTAKIYMLFGVVMLLFFPLMLVGKSVNVFCICYFITSVGYAIVSNAGAVYATEIVGYYDIGSFTSMRLIVMTMGQAISSYGIAKMMGYLPTAAILFLCGMCQAVSGVMHLWYDKKYR